MTRWLSLSAGLVAWLSSCSGRPPAPADAGRPEWELSAEVDVGPIARWPAGAQPAVARSAAGTLVALVSEGQAFVRRVEPGGALGKVFHLGAVRRDVQLVPSSAGVVALYETQDQQIATRLLDAASGEPLADPVLLPRAGVPLGPSLLSGAAGHLVWAGLSRGADGGAQWLLRGLGDDGRDPGAPATDVTAHGTLEALAGGLGGHYGLFSQRLADGGAQLELDQLADDGTPSLLAALPVGVLTRTPVLAATDSSALVAWRDSTSTRFAFVSASGPGPQGQLPVDCASWTAAGQSAEVRILCATASGAAVRELQLLVVREAGLPEAHVLFDDDAGTVVAGPLAAGPSPVALFQHRFSELGRGDWAGTSLLPLSADGLAPAQAATPALERESDQRGGGFASAGAQGPHALLWYDDSQLPGLPLLRGALVSPEGLGSSPTWMRTLGLLDFAGGADLRRAAASNGSDFLVTDLDGFRVVTAVWPGDGGSPGAPRDLTSPTGVRTSKVACGAAAGFAVSWAELGSGRRWVQRLGPDGVALRGSAFEAGAPGPADLLCLGDEALLANAGQSLQLLRVGPAGAVDAGVLAPRPAWAVRLAAEGEVALLVWEERDPSAPDLASIRARRLAVDGGALLDAEDLGFLVATPELGAALGDVGAGEDVFQVLGTERQDGGDTLWLWRVPREGPLDAGRLSISEVLGASNVAAGPLVDGGLLFSYSRLHSELDVPVQRLHTRVLSAPAADLAAPHRPRLLAVGPGCSAATGLSWPLLLAWWWGRRRAAFSRPGGEGGPSTSSARTEQAQTAQPERRRGPLRRQDSRGPR